VLDTRSGLVELVFDFAAKVSHRTIMSPAGSPAPRDFHRGNNRVSQRLTRWE
jgi:hypothetical protein